MGGTRYPSQEGREVPTACRFLSPSASSGGDAEDVQRDGSFAVGWRNPSSLSMTGREKLCRGIACSRILAQARCRRHKPIRSQGRSRHRRRRRFSWSQVSSARLRISLHVLWGGHHVKVEGRTVMESFWFGAGKLEKESDMVQKTVDGSSSDQRSGRVRLSKKIMPRSMRVSNRNVISVLKPCQA